MDSMIPRSFVKANFKSIPAELGVVSGYFAGTAWMHSHEAFMNISGSSFGFFSFKDREFSREDKYIMSVPSLDEWQALSNEEKEECYRAYDNLSEVKYYTTEEITK